MISIICLDNRELAPPDTTLDDDLRLSETVSNFCPNTERQRVFLSVLTDLSQSREELVLRREVLADFVSNPSLLSELRRELDELSRLHGEVNRDRARSASLSRGTYSEASSENQKHALIFLAVSVEKSLEVVVRIAELLRRGHPTSPRLCELMRHAESCTKYASELADICGRITSLLSNGGNMLVRLKINDGGRVCGFEFASGRVSTPSEETRSPLNIKPPLSIMKLFSKPSKHEKAAGDSAGNITSRAENTGNVGAKSNNRRAGQISAPETRIERRVQLPDPGSRLRNRLSYEAYVTLSNILSGFVRELIEGFSRLSDELTFYELALDYINMAKEKELPLCYPEIIEPESDQREPIEISRLYDLLLAGRALAAKDVVPNDICFPTSDSVANRADNVSGTSRADNDSDASQAYNDSGASRADNDSDASQADNVSVTGSADDNSSKAAGVPGILITGENNSGKTVYLRSVGTAQLLFQAGLPVPCESARMRILSAVYTCYAAAEKEFVSGNDAGRFEQEVRILSQLAERIQPNSLLLLNEVFQTTAYSEGAEGLYHILNYFMRHGVNFIAVTHLKELVPLYGGRIRHLVTAPGYRIEVAGDAPS
ncbi:MAG TPA: hypothetical protein H9681_07700 [Firmicutes bacterium]|nr:hypothetical protein [Bacillota bacterium]